MTRPAPRSIRRCGRLAVAGAVAALASPALAVPSLTWDASGTSPAAPRDGSGTWTGAATWSTGSADAPWTDGAYATIGNNTGSGAYTIALTTNVSAGSLEFEPAGAGASYTINGNGSTLAVPSGNVFDYGLPLTLRNVTLPIGDATGNNDGAIVLENGASLRLAAGSTLAATDIVGDVAPTTVYFDGGTFRALANPNTTANPLYVQVVGTSAAYVSTGGLTFDTSQVAAGITFITDALQHDPAVTAAADGGLTVVGGGTLQLGYSKEVPGFNPVETYTGTTTVAAGTTLQLDTGGNTTAVTGSPGTGPFPNTRFVVAGTLSVSSTDAIVGETGATPVTLNGGTLTLLGAASAHLANVTLNGGTITAAAGATGRFTVLAGGELHATANASVIGVPLAFNTGSDVRTDAGTTLTVASPLVDGDAAGQLTASGAGTVLLSGASTYTGPTNVAGGTVNLTAAASLAGTPSIAVGAGAALVVSGAVANAPTLTTSGTVTINGLGGVTGRSVRTFGGTTVQSGGAVLLAASASSATRTDLVVASLTINAGSKFDIGNGDVDVKTASSAAAATQLATLTAAAAGGFNGGLWTGNGLASTAAAADAKRLTAVGVIQDATVIGGATPIYTSFDGQAVSAADVLVRDTYYGDANLDGAVNAADYLRVDNGFVMKLTGWQNGDFNDDGVVDGSDYTLMDNAFNQQVAGTIATPAALLAGGPTATPASESSPFGIASVPEPATVVQFLALISGSVGRRRRRVG